MNENDIIAAVYAKAIEDRRFFSSAAKPERDAFVVSQFLLGLNVSFSSEEFKFPREDDPADLLFRDARFQIKEIASPELRRSDDIKERLARAKQARSLSDLLLPTDAHDIVYSDLFSLIGELAGAAKYSPSVKASHDLLCYVTRHYTSIGNEAERLRLTNMGWRSISCLYGSRAIVLSAAADAPPFLPHPVTLGQSDQPCSST